LGSLATNLQIGIGFPAVLNRRGNVLEQSVGVIARLVGGEVAAFAEKLLWQSQQKPIASRQY
jgi:hypothetical protein